MMFLAPIFAAVAAAIAVPALVILYFLKLRRRDLDISTTLLWKKTIQDMQANAPFQRLRRNLLLFLQLIVLAALLFAVAQPQVKGQILQGTRHVVLIDRSASMAALDCDDGRGGKRSRLDEAKDKAAAFVASLREGSIISKGSGDEAMLIAFDSAAEVRQTFTADKDLLKRVVREIQPTENPTRVEEAVRLARAHVPSKLVENQGIVGGPPITLHLYSDGRIPDADKAKPGPEDSFFFEKIGKGDSHNTAVVGVRSERGYDDPTKLSIFVALQNDEPAVRIADVELVIDGVVAGIKTATVPAATEGDLSPIAEAAAKARESEAGTVAGSDVTPARTLRPGIGGVVFTMQRAQGALVQLRLRSPASSEPLVGDVLPLDDRAWLVVPPARKLSVAVVTKGSLFLSSALSGLPLARLDTLTPDQFESLRQGGKLADFDVVVLDGYLPKVATTAAAKPPPGPPTGPPTGQPNGPLSDGKAGPPPSPPAADIAPPLPPGRFLVLGTVPSSVGLIDRGKGGATGIVDWKRDHPALRAANIEGVVIGQSRRVEIVPGSGADVLASSDSGPVITEFSTAETRAVIVPFDVAESNWPFDVSFVVFLANSVGYLADDAASGGVANARMIQPGAVLADRLPAGAQDSRVLTPDGSTENLTIAPDGRIVFGPVTRSGVYTVSWVGPASATDTTASGRAQRAYAANLFDAAESTVSAQDRIELATAVVQAQRLTSNKADKSLWPWLILAALLVITLEWWIYNRRVYL